MKKKVRLSNIYLAILLGIMYLPIVVIIIYSFNESKISSVWSGFSLKWYHILQKDRAIHEALRNSLLLASLSCLSAGIIGTIGAVGMSRVKFSRSKKKQSSLRMKKQGFAGKQAATAERISTNYGEKSDQWLASTTGIIEYLSMLPIMIPEIILGMVFMTFFALIGLPFGMATLVIAHTTFCIPYIFMMVKARLAGMDPSLEEAARDLGATPLQAFFHILLPLIMPAVISGMLLAFAMSLDDVVISIFVTGPKTNTLPIKIYTQMKTGVTPEINALCSVMLLVTLGIVVVSGRLGKEK